MKIHFDSNQDLGEKRFDAFSEQKVHYKMFKAGKRWLYAGIFMLSMGAGMVGLGGNVAQADTTTETDSTNTDQTVKTPADTGTYTLKSSETATTDQSTTAKETTDAASADQQSDTATATNSNNTDSTQASTTTSDKSASTATSTTSSVKASTAVSSGTTDNTTKTDSPKKAADDSASNNLTNNTAAAQSSSAAISSGDKTNVNASSVSDSGTSNSQTDTQNKATATDATATKAVLKAKLVSDDAKTDSASEPSTLLELAQAIKGLDANKQNAIVADYNKRMATVKAGTMYVLSDGELLPVKVRATNIALTQSYKTDTGTTLSPTTTTNVTADENISEPPYFDGYQIDLNGSNLSIDGTSSTLSAWFGTIQKAQGLVGASVDHSLSSLSDLLYYIRYIYTEGASSTVTGSFDYVYKKSNASIVTKDPTVAVGATKPALSSFITSATDENGDSIAPSAINSPDYDSISTATKGDYTFKVEYFNIDNVSYTQGTATLHVGDPTTTNVATVGSKTIAYGTDKGSGSDYGFTTTQSGTGTAIVVPTTLTSSDYTIDGAKYDASNHLKAGQYTIKLNSNGLAKFATANPALKLDAAKNFATGTLTVSSSVTVGNATSTYGKDTSKSFDYGFKVTASSDSITIPTLTAADFVIDGAAYSTSNHLNAGTYTVELSPAAKSAIEAANPDAGLTDADFKSGTLTVGKAELDINIASVTKGAGQPDPELTATIDGLVDGDSFPYKLNRQPGETIGKLYLISADYQDADLTNYDVASHSGSFIIKKVSTDTFQPNAYQSTGTVDYGKITKDAPVDFGFTHAGTDLKSVTLTASDYTIVNATYSAGGYLEAGTYDVIINNSGKDLIRQANSDFLLDDSEFIKGTLTVNPVVLTVTPDAYEKYYLEPDPQNMGGTITTADGILTGDSPLTYTITRQSGKLDDPVNEYQEIGTVTTPNKNYTVNFAKVFFKIKAPLSTDTLTMNSISAITYGDQVGAFTTTHQGTELTIPELEQSDFTIDGATYTNGLLNAGTYKVELTTEAMIKIADANKNYDFTNFVFPTGTLVVNQKTATITVDDKTKAKGESDPNMTVKTTGVLDDDAANLKYTINRAPGEEVGTYAETITMGDNPNYDFTVNNGTLTITNAVAPGTVRIVAIPATYGLITQDTSDWQYAFVYYLENDDNKQTKLPILSADDFKIVNATYSAGGYLNAGTYTVEISAAGKKAVEDANPQYSFKDANFGTATLTVNKAEVTVTADNNTKVYNGATGSDPALTFTTNADKLLTSDGVDITVKREAGNDVGTYTITASEADSTNYTFTNNPGTFTITPATTTGTVSVSQSDVQYGNDLTPTLTTADGSPLNVNGITLGEGDYQLSQTTKSTSGYYVVGDYTITLTATGLAKLQAANKNYTLTDANATAGKFAITQAPLTITPNDATKVFSYSDPAYTAKLDGLVGSDKVDYTVNRVDAGTAAGESVGSHDLTVTTANTVDSGNYKITLATGALVISALALTGTVTVTTKDKTYGDITKDGDAGFGITLEGHTLDTSTLTPEDYTISAKDTDYSGKYLNAGTYTVSLNDTGQAALKTANPNFDFSKVTFKNGRLYVGPKTIILNVNDASKVYGQPDPVFVGTVHGVVSGETLDVAVSREPGEDVGTYVFTPTLATPNPNYYVGSWNTSAHLRITPATITDSDVDMQVTPNSQTIIFGQTPADFVASFGSKLNQVDLTNADFEFTKQGGSASSSIPTDVGSYTISLTAAAQTAIANANPNYTFTSDAFNKGTFTITPKDTTPDDATTEVTPNDQTITYGDTPQAFTATFGNKLNKVTLTNSDFVFTVGQTKVDGIPKNAGSYTISLTADAQARIKTANPNYKFSNMDFLTGTFTINPKDTKADDVTTQVTVNDQSKVYGDKDPNFDLAYGSNLTPATDLTTADFSFIDGDNNPVTGVPENVGSYTVSLNASGQAKVQKANGNYTLKPADFQTGTFIITAKSTTPDDATTEVTADSQTITFGDTPDAFTATFGDKLNHVTLTNADFTFTKGTTTENGVPTDAGSYEISLTTAAQTRIKNANPNYTFSKADFKTGTFLINPKATTDGDVTTQVTPNSQTITFGDTPDAFTATFGSNLNKVTLTNEDFVFTKGTTTENGVPTDAGSYEISLTDAAQTRIKNANPNYTFSKADFKTGTFLINPKTTTDGDVTTQVKPNNQAITFGDTPGAFTATFGSNLNSVTLTNDDFTFTDNKTHTAVTGIPKNASSYEIILTTDAQTRIKTANPNYTFSAGSFKTGTFTIKPKTTTADDVTTQVKVNDHSIVYGDQTPNFDLTYGDKLTATTGLTNADFSFTDGDNNPVTGVPENVGSYKVSLNTSGQAKVQQANGNYTLKPADFLTGTFTITAKSTTQNDATTEVTADSQTITFGDTPKAFTATFGDKLNNVDLTNDDFVFTVGTTTVDGVPTNAGTYTISLTTAAQNRIKAANPNYKFSDTDFKTGTFLINPKATTDGDETTQTKVNDQNKVYGDKDPNFDLTYGDKLTAPTNLTNADFSFTDGDSNPVTGIPENVGIYTVSLNADGQSKVQAANGNYTLTADDFKTGTFTITAKSTTQNDATTEVTADSQTITFGDTPKAFTATFGDKLSHVTLTDADFTFTDTKMHTAVDGVPTNAGSYEISLTTAAQARIKTANPNYTFSAGDFKTGTFTINPKATTADDVTTQSKVNDQSKVYGDKDPNFDLTYGDKLTAPRDLTNADFSFKDSDGNTITGVPENVGDYTVSLNATGQSKVQAANKNYTLTADDFKTGTFTITAKSTTQNDATTEVTPDSQTITFGDTPKAFTATFGNKLNEVTLTNDDFTFTDGKTAVNGVPTNAGSYTISLTTAAQNRIKAANPNYTFSVGDFKTGTFTINPKATTGDDATTQAKVNDQSKVYGDKDPNFDLTYGDNLTAPTDLTNADFSFTDSKSHTVDGVPENVGTYTVSLNANGQAKVQAANGNYTLTADDFKTGTFTITAKPTTPGDVTTQAKVNNQAKVYGDKDPNFDLTYGDKLTAPTDLTNADFSFTDSKGNAVKGVPENVGTYTVSLNANGQAKVQAANGNYALTADDFKTGTFTITAKSTTPDDATTEVTPDSQTITFGDTPADFTATFGDKLNKVTLSNDDFTFKNGTTTVTGVPTNAGSYEISLTADAQARIEAANPNYTFSAADFKTGIFTINPKATTADDETTQVKVNDYSIVYGDPTPTFNLSYGDKLTGATGLTNADFSFTDNKGNAVSGIPENVGTYTVSLNANGQAKVQAVNGNYTLTADDFKTGTFTITAKPTTADDTTTQAKVNDQSKVYGDKDPNFDLIYGDKLTAPTDLTNADFSFTDSEGNAVTGIPENVGTYTVSLNADGQAKVQAANKNYTLTGDNFKTGTFTITAKTTTKDDVTTEATVNDQTKVYGDKDPNFDLTYGDKLNAATDLTNADFNFKDSKGNAVSGVPENVGTYTVSLNANGQAKVQKANGNYALTADNFKTGRFTITAKSTTPDDATTEVTTQNEVINEGDPVPTFTVSYGSKLINHPVLTNADFSFDGSDTIPTTAGIYTVTLNALGKKAVQDANPNYALTDADFVSGTFTINKVTTDPDGGKTITKTDGSGAIIQIEKDWSDGDKTVVDIDTDTNVATVTETPKGKPSLTPVTVEPGESVKTGKTTVANNEPTDGVSLTHDAPGTATDGTPTTGTTGEVVTPDGTRTYFKSSNGEGVSTTSDNYYTTGTTDDPFGGKTITKTDGSGAIVQIEKDWPDGDKTVVDIDKTTGNAVVTETPKGQPGLTPVTVQPGESVKTGKTTVTNNEPNNGVSLTHDAPGISTDGTPTGGTIGEVVTPDGDHSYFKSSNGEGVSTTANDYYTTGTTDDPFGGKTITKTDGSGAIIQIEKDWPDGDKTVVDIDKTTDNAVVTETPNGQPSLTPVTVEPGKDITVGKTTVDNNEPSGGITLTHETPGTATDGTPTTGTTGEVVTPDGKHSYFKTQVPDGVSTTKDNYYTNTTTEDPNGGKTITKTDGSGSIVQIEKDWPDGDKTVVDIDTDTNVVTVTETPNGKPSLTPITVQPGQTGKVGKTSVTNNEPGSITFGHDTTGTDDNGNPTTGKTSEAVTTPDGTRTYFKNAVPDGVSTTKDNYYTNTTTDDPNGGKTITKTDGSGSIVQIEKDWPDGDKTVVDIDTDTNVVTVTETPKGQPSLTPVTVQPGQTGKAGKTTVANNKPNDGITLTHETPGTATDGTPTTGTTGEVITPDGKHSYFKTQVPDGVSTTKDNYYTNTTTENPNGGKTITKTDGSGSIVQIEKDWPDGDKTVVDIDTDTNVVTVTETPKGQPSLTPVTVQPGQTGKAGKTTVANNEPNGGVTLTHDTIGTDTNGNPTTGTTGEVITPDGTKTYFKTQVPDGVSTTKDDYYMNIITDDPNGGKTITKTDGSGSIVQIEKDWPDGDKTVVDIDTDTNVVTVTETPSGKPSLTPVTVQPGQTGEAGKTSVTNNEPNSITFGHDTTGTDDNGNPTTGTTGETVTTPDGTRTYFKTQVTGGVSTPADGYYVTTTTTDVDGGQTKTTVDGSGAITQVDKTWPDGDQTVVVIDKTGNAVFTETPKGKPSLPSQTVTPGGTATIGGTTLVNNEPTGGIQLTHQTTGSTIVETVDHGGSVNVVVTPNNNGGDNSISTDTGAGTGTGTTTPETPTNGGDNTTTGVDKGTGTETESTHGQTTTGGSSTGSTGSTGVVNTTVTQGQAVSGKQATVAGANSHVSDQTQRADAQGKLPQTNENESAAGATIGLSLLGLLAALGFKRKKRDDE